MEQPAPAGSSNDESLATDDAKSQRTELFDVLDKNIKKEFSQCCHRL
jgi:hypothetical protein